MNPSIPSLSERLQQLKQQYPKKNYFAYLLYLILLLCGLVITHMVIAYGVAIVFQHPFQIDHAYMLESLFLSCLMWIWITLYSFDQVYNHTQRTYDAFGAKSIHATSEIAEEVQLFQLNQTVAQSLNTPPRSLYLLPHEMGINSFSFGLEEDTSVIIFSWGSVFHLTERELTAILYYHYCQILLGDTYYKTHFFVLLRSFHWFNRLAYDGFKRANHARQQQQLLSTFYLSLLALVYYVLGRLYYLLQLPFSRSIFDDRTEWDFIVQHILQQTALSSVLQRVRLYPSLVKIGSCYRADIQHLLFISQLHPTQRLKRRTQHLLKHHSQRLFMGQHALYIPNQQEWSVTDYFRILALKSPSIQCIKPVWHQTISNHYPQDTRIYYWHQDAIRPLHPTRRYQQAQTHYLDHIFPTQSHYLYTLQLILEFRKNICEATDEKIESIVYQSLKRVDPRLYAEIFRQCCLKLHAIPQSIAQQHIDQWWSICQHQQQVHLLDVLLIDLAKFQFGLNTNIYPQRLDAVHHYVVHLLDSILLLQTPLSQLLQQHALLQLRLHLLKTLLGTNVQRYQTIQSHHVCFSEIFQKIAGLHQRERLMILVMIERCLLESKQLTQESFDILIFLYWRLGFRWQSIQQHLYQRHQMTIY